MHKGFEDTAIVNTFETMASDKAHVMHCFLCEFNKGSTTALAYSSIGQTMGDNAFDGRTYNR